MCIYSIHSLQEARLVALSENGDEAATEKLKEVQVDYYYSNIVCLKEYSISFCTAFSHVYVLHYFNNSNNISGVCRIRGYWCSFCRITSPQDLGSKSYDLGS